MKNYSDYDQDQQEFCGLGRRKPTKNQQIYGDFYQAYQQDDKMNIRQQSTPYKSAYNNFKSGSSILNYAAQVQVDIPKKKQKKQSYEDMSDNNEIIGQFNLKSFLESYAKDLDQIEQQQNQESEPICLSDKVIKKLKLIKLGEQSSDDEFDGQNIKDMTYQQYKDIANFKVVKQKQKVLTYEQKQLQKQYVEGYGVGYKMMQKMGFNLSKGLGKEQTGIHRPVQAVFKTALTTKDSEIKQYNNQKQDQQQKNTQDQQQKLPAEQKLFLYRSKNPKVNNLLIDLKNKFESIQSKLYFYEKEVDSYSKDVQINVSLKLQKTRQMQQLEYQINKLKLVVNNVKGIHSANKQVSIDSIKLMSANLATEHKLDLLHVKDFYNQLKNMNFNQILISFSSLVTKNKQFLYSFYLQKQKEVLKKYKEYPVGLKSKNNVINLIDEEVVDLVNQNDQNEQIIQITHEDKQKISKLLLAVIDHTVIPKLKQNLSRYKHIGQVKDYKIYEVIKIIKCLQSESQAIDQTVKSRLKELVINYYNQFNIVQDLNHSLPHLALFPLFQIMSPSQLELDLLLQKISKKLWTIQSSTLLQIVGPILKFCPQKHVTHFINFYLCPRVMYELQEFDLTQSQSCRQLIAGFKRYGKLLNEGTKKDILDNTIIPEIVMTYKNYQKNMSQQDLAQWLRRWNKQIGKVVPNHFQETLKNDFSIYF